MAIKIFCDKCETEIVGGSEHSASTFTHFEMTIGLGDDPKYSQVMDQLCKECTDKVKKALK